MQSAIRESTWYKNVTKDFIDTTPPKPLVPAKKMPVLQDILIRGNKMIDIGFITTIYFILGAIVANLITSFQTEFNNKEAFKVFTVGVDSNKIISQNFLHITTQYIIDDCPFPNILVIPGGNTSSVAKNEKLIDKEKFKKKK
jgi:hypothetical protein